MEQSNNEKLTDKAFMRTFICSVLTILVCMVAIVSTSFAFFTDSLDSEKNVIKTATYSVAVHSADAENNELTPNENGKYSCEANKTYTVTLTATGEASKGYAVVFVEITGKNSDIYYSSVLKHGDTVSFNITRTENFDFYVRGIWGEYDGSDYFNDGDTI